MLESIGHEKIKMELKNSVMSGTVNHAYLFSGRNGIGKKLVATEFAKMILCENPSDSGFCKSCESCRTFGNNKDFNIIEPEKDAIKVDVIRKDIILELFLKPTTSSKKVFIINDAEMMNEQAQNALIKSLEEPPLYATIILITSNKEKLLGTIKSRVTEVKFEGLTKKQIEGIIKKEITDEIYRFSKGSAKEALEIETNENYIVAKEIAAVLEEKDFFKINRKLEEIKENKTLKSNITDILQKVIYVLSDKLKTKPGFNFKTIESANEALQKIKRNANVDMSLDVLSIDVCEM